MPTHSDRIDVLKKMLVSGQFEPFIRHIRFPCYKNVHRDLRIDFTFPVTAIVGANGTGKSSIIRALYGSPGHNNLGNLWFSTSIDSIVDIEDERSCFIYGYRNQATKKVVEVIKTRVHDKEDPDYWEPSRPLQKYNMEKMPQFKDENEGKLTGRTKTRWDPITKNVIYLDFRSALSAYDKFFYHGELRNKDNSYKNKKRFLRRRSVYLKRALDTQASSLSCFKRERVINKENRTLPENEVKAISSILGRSYSEIKLLRHMFFNCDAYTCLLKTKTLAYSEAFAGSGEFSVVRIVTEIINAAPNSLILLDEPEVSLHPGAQDRLMDFLLSNAKEGKHQIVISTHSPIFLRPLPPDGIKVLAIDASGSIILPTQESLADEAFFYIGEPVTDKTTILVEDRLAKSIVEKSLRPRGQAAFNLFTVMYFPGGADTIWANYIANYAIENRNDILVAFDADKRPSKDIPDPKDIPESKNQTLDKTIKDITNVDIKFNPDGGVDGKNEAQLVLMQRQFLNWVKLHITFLPGAKSPEDFIWEYMQKENIKKEILNAKISAKEKFVRLTRCLLGLSDYEAVTGDKILTIQQQMLATIPDDHDELKKISAFIMDFHHKQNSGQHSHD